VPIAAAADRDARPRKGAGKGAACGHKSPSNRGVRHTSIGRLPGKTNPARARATHPPQFPHEHRDCMTHPEKRSTQTDGSEPETAAGSDPKHHYAKNSRGKPKEIGRPTPLWMPPMKNNRVAIVQLRLRRTHRKRSQRPQARPSSSTGPPANADRHHLFGTTFESPTIDASCDWREMPYGETRAVDPVIRVKSDREDTSDG
jgi:hypothetical protein